MKPFVGLPVLFTGKHFTIASQKHAAIIVSVQSDSMVNLTVFNEHGNTYGVVGVRLDAEEVERLLFGEDTDEADLAAAKTDEAD